jgi:hypothetical protein
MTMDLIFSQDTPITSLEFPGFAEAALAGIAVPGAWSRDRVDRLGALTPEDKSAGLIWLALHFPAACDAVLDALEYDDEEEASPEPEPYCASCGAGIGIFLRSGLQWRHFRGDGITVGQIELFDAGHAPVIAWRPARVTTTR